MPPSNTSQRNTSIISQNWRRVCNEVATACAAANRRASEVTIVGVTKYVGPQLAKTLIEAGCTALGENKPQQLWEKHDWLVEQSAGDQVQWHFIGHLQRNKVRRTLPMIHTLHSLDSLRLAGVVNGEALKAGLTIRTFIDVNVTQDTTKTGMLAAQLGSFVEEVLAMPGIRLCGLMAMSSLQADADQARREFAKVRELRDTVAQEFGLRETLTELSMGMSGDFQAALFEGATLVRIGSNLWDGVSLDG